MSLPKQPVYTDEQLLDELRRVCALLPPGVVTRMAVEPLSAVSTQTMLRRFGGWEAALTAAGLADRYSGQPVTAKMRAQRARAMPDRRLLEELRRVAAVVGRDTLTRDDIRAHSAVSMPALVSRFGSWPAALEVAGLRHSPLANRWTDDELLDNLDTLRRHYGRLPTHAESRRPPSRIAADTYRDRFGSWRRALGRSVEHRPELPGS